MLKKFNGKIPKKMYKVLGKIYGTGISASKKRAYYRSRFLLGMNAEAIDADVIMNTHYSKPIKVNGKTKIIYSGTAIKITDKKFLKKLYQETD